ncbi:uroporphyrinogen-III synthase [Undibacterium sp. LX15W]|uniref:Uroporphyrinogen-III synthase n=2 Tax=Undibacterium flavidum TaxID=2762297 RepID=A0ABR6YDZ1_9BURK|nr:uroporphyrinogen-III synthase [Undibacterium flavidum]
MNSTVISTAIPTVIITRPQHQAQHLVDLLEQVGRQSVVFPMFEIEEMLENPELDQAICDLEDYALVMFVSPNAVDAMLNRIAEKDWQWPSSVAIAVVGAASRQALLKHGIDEAAVRIISPTNTERTDSETLLEELDLTALRGQKVLIVRADSGRDFFADALLGAQINVQAITAYRRITPIFDESKKQELQTYLNAACAWVVTSSAVLRTLLAWCSQLDQAGAVAKMQQQNLYVPHFRIAEVARELGFKHISLSASGDEKLLLALQSSL